MPTVEQAVSYLTAGLSIVPIKPGEKAPMVDWMEFQHRRPTIDEVRKWWEKEPNANIGLITGKISNLVVVDIEKAGCPGELEYIMEHMPTRLISKTGGGGHHLYYTYPAGVNRVMNKVKIRPNVDVRGDGGIIVLPPSVHRSGNEYKWVMQQTLGEFNARWAEKKSKDPELLADTKWISSMMDGVGEGARNDACARLAGYYISKGMPMDVIRKLIFDWNLKNQPPLSESELIIIIKSVESTAKKSSANNNDVEQTFKIVGWDDYARKYGGEEITWIIDDWLPESTIAFIVSPPGSYKTWLLMDLAVSVSTGSKFLGFHDVLVKGPVMIIQQEDFHGGLVERLSTIAYNRLTDKSLTRDTGSGSDFYIHFIPDMPIYVHPDRKLRFDNKEVMDKLEDQIATIRPKLIIIDPLYSAASADDYMAKAAESMLRLKSMRDKYGCAFIIAHHTGKNKTDVRAREDLWGSQFLNAFLETGWQVRPVMGSDTDIILRRHFKVKGNAKVIHLKFSIDTENDFNYEVIESTDVDVDNVPSHTMTPSVNKRAGYGAQSSRRMPDQQATKLAHQYDPEPDTSGRASEKILDAIKSKNGISTILQITTDTGMSTSVISAGIKELELKGAVFKNKNNIYLT